MKIILALLGGFQAQSCTPTVSQPNIVDVQPAARNTYFQAIKKLVAEEAWLTSKKLTSWQHLASEYEGSEGWNADTFLMVNRK